MKKIKRRKFLAMAGAIGSGALLSLYAPDVRSVFGQVFNGNQVISQRGISFAGYTADIYSSAEAKAQLTAVLSSKANCVALITTLYQDTATSSNVYKHPARTPSDLSLAAIAGLAHGLGLKVMLKVHLAVIDGADNSELAPTNLNAWFQSYQAAVLTYAKLAAVNGVERFCFGGEIEALDFQNDAKWRAMVSAIRQVYGGAVLYTSRQSNSHFTKIHWWDALDYAGVDAYFPLARTANNPTVSQLLEAWNEPISTLETWQEQIGKQVMFAEVGYRSITGANKDPANSKRPGQINLELQERLYEALFQSFYSRQWLAGIYVWSWFADNTRQGPSDPSYSPQGKPALATLANWYSTV
jgi:hypothetical protein